LWLVIIFYLSVAASVPEYPCSAIPGRYLAGGGAYPVRVADCQAFRLPAGDGSGGGSSLPRFNLFYYTSEVLKMSHWV